MNDAAKPPTPPARPMHEALPHGTRFGEFEIIRVLGVGGFGVVYLANDYSLERQVALKEYMPASLATTLSIEPCPSRRPCRAARGGRAIT